MIYRERSEEKKAVNSPQDKENGGFRGCHQPGNGGKSLEALTVSETAAPGRHWKGNCTSISPLRRL